MNPNFGKDVMAQLGFGKKIKRSSTEALKIMHRMLLDDSYKYSKKVQNEFRALHDNDVFYQMNLGKHLQEFVSASEEKEKKKKWSDNKKMDNKRPLNPYVSQALKE